MEDLIRVNDAKAGRCELVDNTLVEKAMGWSESLVAAVLLRWLGNFVESVNAGILTGADGMTMLFPGVIRGTDVAFVSWQNLPNREFPQSLFQNLHLILSSKS